jgi:hypothetical protein
MVVERLQRDTYFCYFWDTFEEMLVPYFIIFKAFLFALSFLILKASGIVWSVGVHEALF